MGVGGGGSGGQSDITTSCVLSQGGRTFLKLGVATGRAEAGTEVKSPVELSDGSKTCKNDEDGIRESRLKAMRI